MLKKKTPAKSSTRVLLEDRVVRQRMTTAAFERAVRDAWKAADPTGLDEAILRQQAGTALSTLRASVSGASDEALLDELAKGVQR